MEKNNQLIIQQKKQNSNSQMFEFNLESNTFKQSSFVQTSNRLKKKIK